MDVGAHVYEYFRARGLSPAQAAGIVGNTQQESSNNPAAPGGGLDQGQGARFHPGNLEHQLHGIYDELQTSERGTLQALKAAKGPREAARVFSERFERPGIPDLANRERYAQEALQRYGGRAVVDQHAAQGAQLADGIAPHLESSAGSQAVASLLSQLGQSQQQGSSLASTALARPASAGGPEQAATGPRVPSQLAPAQSKGPDINALLKAVQGIAQNEGAASSPEAPTAAPKVASGGKGLTAPVGVTKFDGKPVAAWIAPALAEAQRLGWKGTVESGYRSKAEQERIYNSGVRPAAVPGTSNHELKAFPGGAVDVTDAAQLSKILLGTRYAKLLVYAGTKDPVHFSHPHNGSY